MGRVGHARILAGSELQVSAKVKHKELQVSRETCDSAGSETHADLRNMAHPKYPQHRSKGGIFHFPLAKPGILGHADNCESSLFTSARIRGCIVVETGSDADGQSWPLASDRLPWATCRVGRTVPLVTPLLCIHSFRHRHGWRLVDGSP